MRSACWMVLKAVRDDQSVRPESKRPELRE